MKKIVIVGAGIAGLTAGIYARESGFEVDIYEAHTIPGGASTSWRRKGYLFEGGMHWLTGSSPNNPLNHLWRELGALEEDTPIYCRDPFLTLEYQGQTAHLYRDTAKLEAHLTQLSPEDKDEIHKLCKDVGRFTKLNMPIGDIKGVQVKYKAPSSKGMAGMLALLPRMGFYNRITAKELAMRYKSPLLQKLFLSVVGEESGALATVFTLATFASGDGGYPLGGSLAMARRMADRFTSLGGHIHYDAPVEQVLLQDGIAQGIKIKGEAVTADAVIVTQDTLKAVDTLFSPPLEEPWIQRMKRETRPMLNTFISLGVEADLSGLPESLLFFTDTPLQCGGQSFNTIGINNYASYQGYAPQGCTSITSILMGDSYDYWLNCRQRGVYQEEKERLAKDFIKIIRQKWPQTAGKAAVWDVATPLTYERYCGSFKGSWMSIMGPGASTKGYPTAPETIQNLYFAGQRMMVPGGLPVALQTGRTAVQYLCRDTNTVFQGDK